MKKLKQYNMTVTVGGNFPPKADPFGPSGPNQEQGALPYSFLILPAFTLSTYTMNILNE